ncbi:MAG: hypothetical protein II117_05005 [Clostridia bacterium]|nr:hypothetical protein [Clostridia bacterium]
MKKRTICAIGLAMLLSLGACTANAASTEDNPGAGAQDEQAAETREELTVGSPDGQVFQKEREMPTDGTRPDGRGRHGNRNGSETSTDSAQPNGQGRHGNRDGSATQGAPDGQGRPQKGDGSNGGKNGQNMPSDGGGLTIVEPPEQAGDPVPDPSLPEDGAQDQSETGIGEADPAV